MYDDTLPTIEECHAFLRVVNDGRAAYGLPPLRRLDFDASEPGDPHNCLSARHLAQPISEHATVGRAAFGCVPDPSTLADALLTRRAGNDVVIPDAIRRLTDPFDNELEGLRDRLIEAELVDP